MLSVPTADGLEKIDGAAGNATATEPGGSLAVKGGGLKLGVLDDPPWGREGGGLKLGEPPLAPLMVAAVMPVALPGMPLPTSCVNVRNDI